MTLTIHNKKGRAVQNSVKVRGELIYREYITYTQQENRIMLTKLARLKDMLDKSKRG